MEARLDYYSIAPEAAKIMMSFERYERPTDLDSTLLELVKTRASQINDSDSLILNEQPIFFTIFFK